ncbi:MAG: thioredoxin family protein [Archaeoglobus sp.]|nr:thioredoxin family protein [Archaeoglobus sp.]
MIRKLALILIISGFILVIASQMYATQELVEWKEFDQANTLAKETKKPIFVYFYSDSCPYCRLMSSKVFSDKQIASLLNSKFIPVKVNVRTDKIVMKFVPAFEKNHLDFVTPSYIILSPDGNVTKIETGYLDINEFKSFILSLNK